MRGRRRSYEWPASGDPHLSESGADAVVDVKCDEALRALVRLLGRQAARDMFEHESTNVCSDNSTDEGRQ